MSKKLFFLCILLLCTNACSLAPLMTPQSARPLGKNKWGMEFSASPSIGVTGAYGVMENWDIGVLYEQQIGNVLGLWTKYAFVNNEKGVSFGLFGGAFVGAAFGSSDGYYVGPILSGRWDWFEPALSVRYNSVTWRTSELTSENRDDGFFEFSTFGDIQFDYIQTDLIFSFWVSKKFSIVVSAKHISLLDDKEILLSSSVMPGIGFGLRF